MIQFCAGLPWESVGELHGGIAMLRHMPETSDRQKEPGSVPYWWLGGRAAVSWAAVLVLSSALLSLGGLRPGEQLAYAAGRVAAPYGPATAASSRGGFPPEKAGEGAPRTRWELPFAWYQWFIESAGGGSFWFHTGERFEGPVHVNGDIRIDGDPWFGGPVTTHGVLVITEGGDPTFEMGYWPRVDPIELPSVEEIYATVRDAAQFFGGLYAGPLGDGCYYEVGLGVPVPGHLTYAGYDAGGAVIAPPVTIDLSLLNGAAWFDETIRIWGVLDGQLTIGADSNIEIMDDIIYEGSTPGSGLDPDCDDMLGLIAAGYPDGDIIFRDTPANMSDCEIHAVMMALHKNIEAEDFMAGPPRGELTTHGSMLAAYSILLGEIVDDVVISGYIRDYHYDERVIETPPPFFPTIEIETGAEDGPAVSLAPCSPSPFRGSTTICFTSLPGRPATVAIHDVSGRLVRTVFEGVPQGGSAEVRWDGRDRHGDEVASGIYFVRMETGVGTRTRKVVALR